MGHKVKSAPRTYMLQLARTPGDNITWSLASIRCARRSSRDALPRLPPTLATLRVRCNSQFVNSCVGYLAAIRLSGTRQAALAWKAGSCPPTARKRHRPFLGHIHKHLTLRLISSSCDAALHDAASCVVSPASGCELSSSGAWVVAACSVGPAPPLEAHSWSRLLNISSVLCGFTHQLTVRLQRTQGELRLKTFWP